MATCPSFLGRRCCRQLPWVEWTDAVAASRAVRRRAALGVCTGGRTFDRRAAGCAAGVAAGRRGASAAARTSRGRRHGTYGGIKHHGGHRDAARPAAGGHASGARRSVLGDKRARTLGRWSGRSPRRLAGAGVGVLPAYGCAQQPPPPCTPRLPSARAPAASFVQRWSPGPRWTASAVQVSTPGPSRFRLVAVRIMYKIAWAMV